MAKKATDLKDVDQEEVNKGVEVVKPTDKMLTVKNRFGQEIKVTAKRKAEMEKDGLLEAKE